MRGPYASGLLDAWDSGSRASSAERALLLLGTVRPELACDLAVMPLGWIIAQLLELRRNLIGPTLDCLGDCVQCGTAVECEIAIDQLVTVAPLQQPRPALLQVEEAGYKIEFRLPTCGDLVTLRGDPKAAAHGLAQRIVSRASRSGVDIAAADLPAELQRALERAVLDNDPLARVELTLECPACARLWTDTLDVVDFVWNEFSALAQRLLRDVARLAYVFGWREADILAMSEHRRRRYLEMLP
jgi:hypothetical protein